MCLVHMYMYAKLSGMEEGRQEACMRACGMGRYGCRLDQVCVVVACLLTRHILMPGIPGCAAENRMELSADSAARRCFGFCSFAWLAFVVWGVASLP